MCLLMRFPGSDLGLTLVDCPWIYLDLIPFSDIFPYQGSNEWWYCLFIFTKTTTKDSPTSLIICMDVLGPRHRVRRSAGRCESTDHKFNTVASTVTFGISANCRCSETSEFEKLHVGRRRHGRNGFCQLDFQGTACMPKTGREDNSQSLER